jgi:hypothetical protein
MLLQVTENITNFNITDLIKTHSFSLYYEFSKDPDWYKTFQWGLKRESPVGTITQLNFPVGYLTNTLERVFKK